MFPNVVALTMAVVIGKLAEEAPAATVTLGETLAAEFALARCTTAPLVGAGPVKLTTPVADCPPMALAGVSVSEFNTAEPAVERL